MDSYQLIGSEVSLYTGKVRAYLRYKQIPFKEVLSTAEVYKSIIIPRTGVRFIPVLITDDDIAIQDSTDIIDFCEQRSPSPSVYPTTPCQRLIALLLEVYGDEWLVNPAMQYRWAYQENRDFAIREFGRTSAPDKSLAEQEAIGRKNATPFAGALPRLGITEKSAAAVESSYLKFLDDFNLHLGDHPFLLGARPSIGDYGLIGPLYAHLYRDPYSGRLMKTKAPNVANWVERMQEPKIFSGDFLPDDQIPETIFPILARMFSEQIPVIHSTIDRIKTWAESSEDPHIPRAIGVHTYCIEGLEEERFVLPNNVWMWQRPYDYYHSLTEDQLSLVTQCLQKIPGGGKIFQKDVSPKLERKNNQLVLKLSM